MSLLTNIFVFLKFSVKMVESVTTSMSASNKESVENVYRKGVKASEANDYDGAAYYYKYALKFDPNNEKYLKALAYTLKHLERYEEASKAYEKCLSLDFNNEIYREGIAECNYAMGNYKKALENFRYLSIQNPKNANFFLSIGKIFFELEMYEEAVDSYIKASKLSSHNSLTYSYIADAKWKIGLLAEAENFYLMAIKAEPTFAVNYARLAQFLFETSRFERALKYYKKAYVLGFNDKFVRDRIDKLEEQLSCNKKFSEGTNKAGSNEKTHDRYLIDGTNVLRSYLPQKAQPSLEILLSLLVGLLENGIRFLCFFDANTRHVLKDQVGQDVSDLYIYIVSYYEKYFVEVPGGIQADNFILEYANNSGESIISNDRYRDHYNSYAWLESSTDRLLKGMLADNQIIIPSIHFSVQFKNDLILLKKQLEMQLKSSYKWDPHQVLGVSHNASADEIKKAYLRLANQYHPDKVQHLGKEFRVLAEIKFKEIQKAYEELKKRR